jgi:hypothetical protein
VSWLRQSFPTSVKIQPPFTVTLGALLTSLCRELNQFSISGILNLSVLLMFITAPSSSSLSQIYICSDTMQYQKQFTDDLLWPQANIVLVLI